jgi:hypothetical protein
MKGSQIMKKLSLSMLTFFILVSIGTPAVAVDPDYGFTGCTPFTLGYGLYVTHEFQGQAKCYDTYSAVPTKLEAIAVNQPVGVNYDIYVFWYNSATASLELQSYGLKTGNSDERPQAVVPAGNYVIYTEATLGFSATSFIVGALDYPTYDAQEMNDTAPTATPL